MPYGDLARRTDLGRSPLAKALAESADIVAGSAASAVDKVSGAVATHNAEERKRKAGESERDYLLRLETAKAGGYQPEEKARREQAGRLDAERKGSRDYVGVENLEADDDILAALSQDAAEVAGTRRESAELAASDYAGDPDAADYVATTAKNADDAQLYGGAIEYIGEAKAADKRMGGLASALREPTVPLESLGAAVRTEKAQEREDKLTAEERVFLAAERKVKEERFGKARGEIRASGVFQSPSDVEAKAKDLGVTLDSAEGLEAVAMWAKTERSRREAALQRTVAGQKIDSEQLKLTAPNDSQAKKRVYAANLNDGMRTMDSMIGSGFDPSKVQPIPSSLFSGVPFVGKPLTDYMEHVVNQGRSPAEQQYIRAGLAAANAILRSESGAVVTPAELQSKFQEIIPQFGDKPGVIRDKLQQLEQTRDLYENAAGFEMSEEGAAVPWRVPNKYRIRSSDAVAPKTLMRDGVKFVEGANGKFYPAK